MLLCGLSSAQVCLESQTPVPPSSITGWRLQHADLDGDGDQDLIVASPDSSAIAIYWNQGDGSFSAPTVLSPGLKPFGVTAADFDGDGRIDLALIDHDAGMMGVMLNQGGGVFAAPVLYGAPVAPTAILHADFDGDGAEDLVVPGDWPSWIIVFHNQGNGSFTVGTVLVGGIEPFSIAAGDLDGDGDVDLAVANFDGNGGSGCGCAAGNSVWIFANNGDGTFASEVSYPVGMFPTDVAIADLDHDGDLDVVTANWLYGGITVLWNHGDGTFPTHANFAGPYHPESVTIADLDGDGDLDIATANYFPAESMAIFSNQGNGTFASGPLFSTSPNPAYAVTSADLDGDGDVDLALSTLTPGLLLVYRNCTQSGIPFCAGDGSGTACPCGNASAPGIFAGCLNSTGQAGTLRGSGSASLAQDHVALIGSGMTSSAALYFQGTTEIQGGAVFGDGLRCVGGTLVRLGTVINSGGASRHPAPGGVALSVEGHVTAPGTREYQVRYRNTVAFCTSDTFNLTNGYEVVWRP